jgi:hypothetical protein
MPAVTSVNLQEARRILAAVEDAAASPEEIALLEPGELHLGLFGVKAPNEPIKFLGGLMSLRGVRAPPGVVHLAGKSRGTPDPWLAVARSSSGISAELVFHEPEGEAFDTRGQLHMAWHLAALLRLRSHQVHAPVAASVAWDAIARADNGSVEFILLDDVPATISTRTPTRVSGADIAWIDANFMSALIDADASRRLGLALRLLYTWNLTRDYRVGLTLIWAGLEALFGDQNDQQVTASLAARLTQWVPSVSEREARAMYKLRSDAVHGRELSRLASHAAVAKSEEWLRLALVACVEQRRRPLADWQPSSPSPTRPRRRGPARRQRLTR